MRAEVHVPRPELPADAIAKASGDRLEKTVRLLSGWLRMRDFCRLVFGASYPRALSDARRIVAARCAQSGEGRIEAATGLLEATDKAGHPEHAAIFAAVLVEEE